MWKWIKNLLAPKKPVVRTTPKPEITKEDSDYMPWYKWASNEIGTNETHNPQRVTFYHSNTSLKKEDWKPSTSWCASFVSSALSETGYKSPRTAWARTFLTYGKKLSDPTLGCIMVFERNDPGGDSHVTFWTGKETEDSYHCLGGNQANSVCVRAYPKKDFLGAAWPIKEAPVIEPISIVTIKAAWDHKPEGRLWTQYTVEALKTHGAKMLLVDNIKDDDEYCRRFDELTMNERLQFYVMLISTMAQYESGFDPKQTYKEGFNDAQGKPVLSRGLLQMSKESVNQSAYGGNIKNAEELHDPRTNLICAVKILNYWIPKDKCFGSGKLGGARYWSVLRDSSKSQAKIRAKVQSVTF